MDTGVVIPLGIFAMVALIVAITQLVKIRDIEMDVHQQLHQEELEHQRRMRELDLELERVRGSANEQ
jgi:hypothetical protein